MEGVTRFYRPSGLLFGLIFGAIWHFVSSRWGTELTIAGAGTVELPSRYPYRAAAPWNCNQRPFQSAQPLLLSRHLLAIVPTLLPCSAPHLRSAGPFLCGLNTRQVVCDRCHHHQRDRLAASGRTRQACPPTLPRCLTAFGTKGRMWLQGRVHWT